MPGGSVNGRPFREGPDSYSRTGIPCGNPKRFQSRDVVKMGVQNQSALSKPLNGPVEDIETESDRQLQNLLQKQLNTKISIDEQFKQHKRFSDGVRHVSATDRLSGTVSLDDYKGLSQLDGYIVELKHCGLTGEEIELKLEDMGQSKPKKLRSNLEPGIRESKLVVIEEKIAAKKRLLEEADMFAGARRMGRHEMDLERALSQNSDRTKHLSCLLTSSQNTRVNTDQHDPMDHLPEILDIVTKRAKASKSKCKKRKVCGTDDVVSGERLSTVGTTGVAVASEVEDKKVICSGSEVGGAPNTPTEVGDSKAADQTHTDSPSGNDNTPTEPRSLCGRVDPIPEADIIRERLTVSEIRQLPRFTNYTPGQPSQVLYVKNLAPKVCEEDLVRLFIRFQETGGPQILFKLMKGRMKRQAFVTFDSVHSATEALDLVNGYNFKGKPIIIQYGKQPPTDS